MHSKIKRRSCLFTAASAGAIVLVSVGHEPPAISQPPAPQTLPVGSSEEASPVFRRLPLAPHGPTAIMPLPLAPHGTPRIMPIWLDALPRSSAPRGGNAKR